jgi:septum formation protein
MIPTMTGRHPDDAPEPSPARSGRSAAVAEPVKLARRVVLASGSPFRAKLLSEAHIPFTVSVSDVDESLQPMTAPEAYAAALALSKARSVASRERDAVVIGADTICAMGDEILGKPRDEEDAVRMISRACEAGVQRVISGVAIVDGRTMKAVTGSVTSLVELRSSPMSVIRAYVATGEPMGKCGALCIEGNHNFVKRWEGSYSNIVGLPLEWLLPRLMEIAGRA